MASTQVKLPSLNEAAADSKQKMHNPRRMRRIIVEDPEWNLNPVPTLIDLCVDHIIKTFQSNPVLDAVPAEFRQKVVDGLTDDLPLSLAVKLIPDEAYWEKIARKKYRVCKVAEHGDSWKRLYFERYVAGKSSRAPQQHRSHEQVRIDMVENYVPGSSDEEALKQSLDMSKDYVIELHLKQLQPPWNAPPPSDEAPNAEVLPETASLEDEDGPIPKIRDDDEEDETNDHIDLSTVVELLPNLQKLFVSYKKKDCGMQFKWSMFGLTSSDAVMLGDCVKYSGKLQSLTVTESRVNDAKARVLAAKALNNPDLVHMDLSHNTIGDRGTRALAKLLNGNSVINDLNLSDNQIASVGARALGVALTSNVYLTTLNLRLNAVGDQGGNAIFQALCGNTTLTRLNISFNGLTPRIGSSLSEMIEKNTSLQQLDISGNDLEDETGKKVLDAMDSNKTLQLMDIRLTGFAKDTELGINDILRNNMKAAIAASQP